jgi:arginase
MQQRHTVELIGAEIGEGAGVMGCKAGPAALRAQGLSLSLTRQGCTAVWGASVSSHAELLAQSKLAVVQEFTPRLAQAACQAMQRGRMPVVVGGDHSCAVGTWSGVATALKDRGDLGLLWIDAHLDAHTPHTSESQHPHGMPLAALLGHGDAALTGTLGWQGKLKPQHVVVLGARSYEQGEHALLQRLGVRIMDMQEITTRGFATCFAEALAIVNRRTAAYGITFDVDALDPQDAPGVGTPVERGIRLHDALAALRSTTHDTRLAAFELVEYNPALDHNGMTARACQALIEAALVENPASAAPLQQRHAA